MGRQLGAVRLLLRIPRCFGAAALAAALPATASADNLADALLRAYQTSPDLAEARARLRAIDENVALARASGRPRINSTGSLTQTWDEIGTFRDRGRTFVGAGSAGWSVYAGGRVRNTIRAADARVIAGRADLRAVEGDVFTAVVAAYMNVIRDAYIVELNANLVRVLENDFSASRSRFRGGDLTRTDVAQSEARLANARGQLASAQNALTASSEEYRRVVGIWPIELEPPAPLPVLPDSVDRAAEIALASAPDLQSGAANAQAAAIDVDVARATRLPTLSLGANASYTNYLDSRDKALGVSSNRGLDQVQTSASVGVTASLPLYQGGGPAAGVRQAKAFQSIAQERQIGLERAVIASVRTAYSSLRAATALIQASQASVAANRVALRGARQEQAAGTRTFLDVLNAEQELLGSQVANVAAERDRYVAGFSLLNAMGKVSMEQLGLEGGALYDPLANYRGASHSISDWDDGPLLTVMGTRTAGSTPVNARPVRDALPSAPISQSQAETLKRPSLEDPSKPREQPQ
jgi:outer membrane protein